MPLARFDAPFEHPDWIFEPKLDGFRAVAYVEGGACRLVSRNRNAFKTFEPLAQAPVLLGPPVAARPVGMGTQVSDFGHLVPNSGSGAGAGQCFHASKTDFGLPKSLPGKP